MSLQEPTNQLKNLWIFLIILLFLLFKSYELMYPFWSRHRYKSYCVHFPLFLIAFDHMYVTKWCLFILLNIKITLHASLSLSQC